MEEETELTNIYISITYLLSRSLMVTTCQLHLNFILTSDSFLIQDWREASDIIMENVPGLLNLG